MSEAELSVHVAVAVLEDQDGGLVDLNGAGAMGGAKGVVHVGLLARRHAAIDLADEAVAQHLEEHQTRARVQHLLRGGAIGPVDALLS